MRVIKIGGNELTISGFIEDFAKVLEKLAEPAIVVHGGGKEIDELQFQLGQQPIKIQGMRRTDTNALNAAMMILCGLVSKKLVAGLINAGVDAVGLSGVDGGMLRAKKHKHPNLDLGFVGEIVDVRSDLLFYLSSRGMMPVISPISLGDDGQIYNVNADEAASCIAISIHAHAIDFISNVPGVVKDDELIPLLTEQESEHLILKGAINSGMVPKVRAAFKAAKGGVPNVRIVDLNNLAQEGGTHILCKETIHPSEAMRIYPGGSNEP
ncbi:MAG: acetylglutamate kinase [Chloroflexi bacterium RBG_16_48_8]|nr:MAG: acetylglutamate kinase [Chloroflexi bacterium RBG_16_48_8]